MHLAREWLEMLCVSTKAKLKEIENHVAISEANGDIIYPPAKDRYNAFKISPSETRVAIFGQDPFHGAGQAMGLSFSVPKGIRVPPSLRNIYKELAADYPGIFDELPSHGDLSSWAEQGVLLLNTVEAGKPGSHKRLGWDVVTSEIVYQLSRRHPNIVFVLWGNHARNLKQTIHQVSCKSLVIESSHPSPIGGSCNKGFFGSRPFSRVNAHLQSLGISTIDWCID